ANAAARAISATTRAAVARAIRAAVSATARAVVARTIRTATENAAITSTNSSANLGQSNANSLQADTGRFVARCNNCAPGAAYPRSTHPPAIHTHSEL
ncbi:TPA: hypothetical protein N0F65_006076, partial [Lagenidium giganteum]